MLGGTLVLHCPPLVYRNSKNLMDDHGTPRGCSWLKCTECGFYGVPGTAGWVREPGGTPKA